MLGISIEKAPEQGFILACFRDRPVFGRYERKSGEIVLKDGKPSEKRCRKSAISSMQTRSTGWSPVGRGGIGLNWF